MRNVASSVGPVLLWTPTLSVLVSARSSHAPTSNLVSASSDDSLLVSSNSALCACCSRSSSLRSLSVSVIRTRKRARRFLELVLVKGSKEDGAGPDEGPEREPERGPVDWDEEWSSYTNPSSPKKTKKLSSFFKIDMEQYVNRRPGHSNYPLSEEVDPLRKSERSALGAWTSTNFTYAFVGVIIGLFVYMVIIVGPPPRH